MKIDDFVRKWAGGEAAEKRLRKDLETLQPSFDLKALIKDLRDVLSDLDDQPEQGRERLEQILGELTIAFDKYHYRNQSADRDRLDFLENFGMQWEPGVGAYFNFAGRQNKPTLRACIDAAMKYVERHKAK